MNPQYLPPQYSGMQGFGQRSPPFPPPPNNVASPPNLFHDDYPAAMGDAPNSNPMRSNNSPLAPPGGQLPPPTQLPPPSKLSPSNAGPPFSQVPPLAGGNVGQMAPSRGGFTQNLSPMSGSNQFPAGAHPADGQPSAMHQPPPTMHQAPPTMRQAPPTMHQNPSGGQASTMQQHSAPTMHQGPPTMQQAPPTMQQAPPTMQQNPPGGQASTMQQHSAPTMHQAPPTMQQAPPGGVNAHAPPPSMPNANNLNAGPPLLPNAGGGSSSPMAPHHFATLPGQQPGNSPLMGQNAPPLSGMPTQTWHSPMQGQQMAAAAAAPPPMMQSRANVAPPGRPLDNLNANGMMGAAPPPMGKPGPYPPPPGPPTQFPPTTNTRPPIPGQNAFPPHQQQQQQLPAAMQDLNLGAPPHHPSYPKSPSMLNGDHAPHMPPPLHQYPPTASNYINGQQQQQQQPPMKSPTYPAGYPPQAAPPLGGGYPPQPGHVPPGGYTSQYQPQQQQQRRLDPDQMPSPIAVMQEDERTRSGLFVTNQKGLVPPLVTTQFRVQDRGNCSPRYIRSTMYNVPITQELMKETSIPFGLTISPMARTADGEMAPPIVDFGEVGPVRCIRCKAYMCPYMQFIDAGRRFQCLFCKATSDVPNEYFAHLDHTGQRMDRFERAELSLGTYELVATTDYCRNNVYPQPPAIVFVIDVSYNSVRSGVVALMCAQMKEIVRGLPVDAGMERSNMRVGFITYDASVHFYNIKGTLAAPQMMIVGDVQDMFMPLLDGFLCTPDESETVIDALMDQIPAMFSTTRETQTVLLPAILAGLEALKAAQCTGKLLVFTSTLPAADAPGKLKMRDDRKLLATEKERTILTAQTQAYNQLGQECVAAGCSVDLFLVNNSYIDVATIGQVARLSGGEVYKYTYFQADMDGDRLIQDVIKNIQRPVAFDAIMRVRTSTGVRPTDFYGHFFMSNTTDMELAAIDCDKAVAVEIKHDDKLAEEEGVYVQVALLYTSCAGQRRLRIMNLALRTCAQMTDLYRSCDLDTMVNFFAKQATYRLLENAPKAVKDGIVQRAAQILANYRKRCASPSSSGQLILPECMKLLPLYVNCLLRSDALSGGSDMTVDDRSFVMQAVMIMDVPSSVKFFYPRLIPLHEMQPLEADKPINIPPPQRCSIEKMQDNGLYLLENGIHMMLWIGLGLSPDMCQQVFGVPTPAQIDIERTALPPLENPLSVAVRAAIDEIRATNARCMRLTLVKQKEKLEPVFKHFLVEDRGLDGSPSYVEFLCHMHKEIRNILS